MHLETQVTPELASAVENAYREFARYRLKGSVTVCRCPVCVAEETVRALDTVPLSEMSSGLLAEYTHSAHGWDGKVEDELRHFLPRYFELIAAGDPPSNTGIETSLQRLHDAAYRQNWPTSEVEAIDLFFLTLLRAEVSRPIPVDWFGMPKPECTAVEDVLCMAAHAGGDLAPLLAAWEADRSRAASMHIANVIGMADWRRRRLRNVFWYGWTNCPQAEAAADMLMEWLMRHETQERLEVACLAEHDEGAAALLSHAEGIVAGLVRA